MISWKNIRYKINGLSEFAIHGLGRVEIRNYPLVPVKNRTLVFHTIAVAPSNTEVIILQVLYFLLIYLYSLNTLSVPKNKASVVGKIIKQ
jgi:hypothetical protein